MHKQVTLPATKQAVDARTVDEISIEATWEETNGDKISHKLHTVELKVGSARAVFTRKQAQDVAIVINQLSGRTQELLQQSAKRSHEKR